eukprot:355369-Chlamydomonas_euryale.AAC.16
MHGSKERGRLPIIHRPGSTQQPRAASPPRALQARGVVGTAHVARCAPAHAALPPAAPSISATLCFPAPSPSTAVCMAPPNERSNLQDQQQRMGAVVRMPMQARVAAAPSSACRLYPLSSSGVVQRLAPRSAGASRVDRQGEGGLGMGDGLLGARVD